MTGLILEDDVNNIVALKFDDHLQCFGVRVVRICANNTRYLDLGHHRPGMSLAPREEFRTAKPEGRTGSSWANH